MIQITRQDAVHQYDASGSPITTWDDKKCCWIVNQEFENEKIDWYGNDNDFPPGRTLTEYLSNNPDWDKKPDITVTWYWYDKATCIRAFGQPHTFGQRSDYWDIKQYPYTVCRNWGYIDASEGDAINTFGKYCNFHTHADRTIVSYNGKVLFDGKLT